MTTYSGGNEANSWTLTNADGQSSVDGGGGIDTLTINIPTYAGAAYGAWNAPGTTSYLYHNFQIDFVNIERLFVTFGSGADSFYNYANGDMTLTGGSGNDSFYGGSGGDTLNGGANNDILDAGRGTNAIDGGTGYDQGMIDFSDRAGAVVLVNNGVAGTTYTATVSGVNAGTVANVEVLGIQGGSAGDTLGGVYTVADDGYYDTTIDGNGGIDMAVVNLSSASYVTSGFSSATDFHLYGYSPSNWYLTVNLAEIEALDFTGTGGNDSLDLLGVTGASTLRGGGGNDVLRIGGNSVIDGGSGYDQASLDYSNRVGSVILLNNAVAGTTYTATVGGVASGSVTNVEVLSVAGGSANDQLGGVYTVIDSAFYYATIDGNGGNDTAVVNLSSAQYVTSSFSSPSEFYLRGYSPSNCYLEVALLDIEVLDFTGSAGVDGLYLGGVTGASTLRGGAGNDILQIGGRSTIDGGADYDQAYLNYSNETQAVVLVNGAVAGTTYTATVGGAAAGSIVNVEVLGAAGGSGNDRLGGVYAPLNGSNLSFEIDGNGGADTAVADFSAASYVAYNYAASDSFSITGYAASGGLTGNFLDIESLDFTGTAGNDSVLLPILLGDSILRGGAGDDQLESGAGNDTLQGGADNDILAAGTGNNVVDGGTGRDVARFDFTDRTQAVVMLNGAVGGTVYGATVGGAAAGSVTNVEALEVLGGSAGDRIGGTYTPALDSYGSFLLDGNGGIDTAVLDMSGASYLSSSYSDPASFSIVGYAATSYYNYVNLYDIEGLDLTASAGDDYVYLPGLAAASILRGGTGNDNFTTGSGNDTLQGGADNDTLVAGTGNDVVDGGTGFDLATFDFTDRASAVVLVNGAVAGTVYAATVGGVAAGSVTNVEALSVYGGSGADRIGGVYTPIDLSSNYQLDGNGGTDTAVLDYSGADHVSGYGSPGSFSVTGYSNNGYSLNGQLLDIEGLDFTGSGGTDTIQFADLTADSILRGGAGNDSLQAGAGDDTLQGGADDDILDAGKGINTVDGGTGIDTASFDFSDRNVAVQFVNGAVAGTTYTALVGGVARGTVTNVEGLGVLGGSAGDRIGGVYTPVEDHYINFTLDGNGGSDTAVADFSGASSVSGSYYDATSFYITGYTSSGYNATGSFYDFEALDFTGSAGDDYLNLVTTTVESILRGGAGVDTLTTGSGNDTLQGGTGDDVLAGGGGNDTLQGGADNDMLAGGTGNDTLQGNEGDDTLDAGTGSDVVDGSTGFDHAKFDFTDRTQAVVLVNGGVAGTVYAATVGGVAAGSVTNVEVLSVLGGSGNDRIGGTYLPTDNVYVNDLTLNGNGGTDTAVLDFSAASSVTGYWTDATHTYVIGRSAGGYHIQGYLENIEGVDFTGSAGDDSVQISTLTAASILRGGGGNDTLTTGSGNDILQGGAGDDSLDGGTGSDTASYTGAASGVTVSLVSNTATGGDGTDTLSGIENILGSLYGDTLTGNSGANTLDGYGNADSMTGGGGNDIYVVDNVGDVTVEAAGGGTDTVQASITWTLAANIEHLTLTGSTNINGTGNTLNNIVTGNSGNNTLSGFSGTDTLVGGAGNDVYVVDDATDVVTEAAGEGTDTVQAGFSYTLGANVENLTLTGSGNINGTGNTLGNAITGNGGNNTLDGGAGVDTLAGGIGNDTYVVDNGSDVVTEGAAAGTDTVQASVSYALSANVENLALTGSAAINGTGNVLANMLTGNSGDNVLDGFSGADTMAGGLGNDSYVVDEAGDVVTENAGEGSDTVQAGISYTLGANVENLTLTGTADLSGTGNTLGNAITGNGGGNVLNGGAGADTLAGGMGGDLYIVDDSGDTVIEGVSAGADSVQASVTFTLSANVENLTLIGVAAINGTGNAGGNVLTGNGAANMLSGLDGIDILDGGLGADTLVGGTGDDSYFVDDAGDVVTEQVGEGLDTIYTSVSNAFELSANVENLVLLAGAGNINGYGNALANLITGNDGNNLLYGGGGADTLVGGLGDDTYYVDAVGDVVTEAAGAGNDIVYASINYTLTADVDHLILSDGAIIGTGNALGNTITGNGAANTLNGLDGNDNLNGGVGPDTMVGGTGDDLYWVDEAGDAIVEAVGAGTDTVASTISYSLSGQQLEWLQLLGSANLNATGNGLTNRLFGNSGNNVLDGLAGADTMSGALGNDTYVVDNVGDVVTEIGGEGTDGVQSSVTYTLAANVENLALTGTSAISGFGNALANSLTGNGANNTLDGGGGNDTMAGGLGDDRYFVDSSSDQIIEANGAGTDTVLSSVAFNLTGQFLENLTLTGNANVNATGNGLVNVVTGNSGNNLLDGQGGADTMAGGLGDDTYVVEVVGDVVQEANNAGNDTVQSWVDYSLAGQFIENITLLGQLPNTNATGNSLNNVLNGSGGNNIIDGGLGNDTMAGGLGNDTYYVDSTFDVVTEYANQGTDTVIANNGFTLSGSHIENLTLTGSISTYANGNGLDNILIGNSGANTMNARGGNDVLAGGLGADTLTGEAGLDVFRFDSALGGGNVDTITDFVVADDTIQLDDAIFAAAGAPGTLAGAAFWTGTAAHDLDDRIVYNAATGALFYDADGSNAGAAVQFATLTAGLALSSADFVVI